MWFRYTVTSVKANIFLHTHEPCHDIGRATRLGRLGIKAAQQRSPTEKVFMSTKRVKFHADKM